MRNKSTRIILIAGLALFAGGIYAGSFAKMAAQPMEVFDPKKKKAGEECTSSDECQKHHGCSKAGDKSVCTAPPRPKYKPGVVT